MVVYFIYVLIAFVYAYLIFWIYDGWTSTEETFAKSTKDEGRSFTVVIPARNEEENILSCLTSVTDQDYPVDKVEVVVVDDHSTDRTTDIAHDLERVKVVVLKTKDEGKKVALQRGIEVAQHEIIITIDADCIFHKDWLKLINQAWQDHEPNAVVGPVVLEKNDNPLTRAQYLDIAATMAATANGIHRKSYYLANGANLIFRKDLFYKVGGYDGNQHIASGDDVFLIKKIADLDRDKIVYLKSRRAAATTKAEVTIKQLLKQRVRWASKSKAYASVGIMLVQGVTFVASAAIVFGFILCPMLPSLFFGALFLMFVKSVVDYMFLSQLATFFGGRGMLKGYVLSALFFLIYIIYMALVALRGASTSWKGRKI